MIKPAIGMLKLGRAPPIRRLLMALVLALALPFALFLAQSLSRQTSLDRDRVGNQMLEMARVVSARLDDHIGDIQQVLVVLSAVVGSDPSDAPRNDMLFDTLKGRLPPQVSNLSVWSVDGKSAGTLDRSPRLAQLDVSKRPFFREALATGRLAIEAPFASIVSGQMIGIFAIRIERDGRPVGVIAVSAQLDRMQLLLAPDGTIPAAAVVTVSTDAGTILTRSVDADRWIGKTLAPASGGFADSQRRKEGVRSGPSADNIDRIAGFTTAARVPWLVYVGLPADIAMAPARLRLRQALVAGIALLAFGLGLSAWIARQISQSLSQLQHHARLIGEGNLAIRIESRGAAEIRLLASTINDMAAALDERTTRLTLSEHLLADLYENAPCGYHSLDAEGRFIRINDRELEWLGRDRAELIGKHINEFLTADGRAAFEKGFPRLMEKGHVEDIEYDLPHKSGSHRRVMASATVLTNPDGSFHATRTALYDVTELRRVREKLKRLSQEQSAMLETDLIGIVRLKERRIVWSNAGSSFLLGYEPGELTGQPMRILYATEAACEDTRRDGRAALVRSGRFRCQLELAHKSGTRRWFDLLAMSLPSSPGETLAMLVDITVLKEAQEIRMKTASLEAENQQLVESSRLKDALLANATHELRTPLNGILGYAQLLNSGSIPPGSPKFGRFLGQIETSGRRLLTLIDSMLDFARIASDVFEFHPEPVNVSDWLDQMIRIFEPEIRAKHIGIDVEMSPQLGTVSIDRLRLTQIASTFVSNAVKFSSDGGRVILNVGLEGADLCMHVTDSGIGIADEDLPRLFSPFQQLSEGTSKAHQGIGLGLALARRLAEAQGGSVGVKSRLGSGSVFFFKLPVRLDAAADAPVAA
jgi:PAS domain S-box-containing protein